jgi:iron(III) transport system permease protein
MHRRNDGWSRVVDTRKGAARRAGLLIGLAFLWCSVLPAAGAAAKTIFSMWTPTVVWLAYGMRLISSSLLQVHRARGSCAQRRRKSRPHFARDHAAADPARLWGSWLLVFMIFEREYSTGVYLLAPGTEVIGAQLVSLWQGGAIDVVAALSLINIVLVFIGLAFALRFGVKLRD